MQLEGSGVELSRALHEHICESFQVAPDLARDTDLLREGIIDSMGVMELVSYIEETFAVAVEDDEIIAENFRSVDCLARYVADKKGLSFATQYVERVRLLVADATPADAVVLLATSGDDALLAVPDREVWHFPRDDGGRYGGGKPADGEEALASVQALQAQGATHIVFPGAELWWLEYYDELREYLEAGGATAHNEHGIAFALPPVR